MKTLITGLLIIVSLQCSFAQENKTSTIVKAYTVAEQEVIQLSKDKWQWMADKNVDKLELLFDNKSKFVHMSGTWKKDE